MMMPAHAWVFPARCARVVDGDTLDLVIDQGMHAQRLERVRLVAVDAPEMRGADRPAGELVTRLVQEWVGEASGDWPLLAQTAKSDVFGRYLATVWRRSDGRELNEQVRLWTVEARAVWPEA